MSFDTPPPPEPPPPPPTPASRQAPSVMEQTAAESARLSAAAGAGFSGTDLTGGQGTKDTNTTKTLLGG